MNFSYEDHLVLRVAIGAEKTTVAVEKSYMTYVRASRALHHSDFFTAMDKLSAELAKRSKKPLTIRIKSVTITAKKITICYETDSGAIWAEPTARIVFNRETARKDDDEPLEELISSKGLILSKGEEEALDGFLKEAYEYAYKDKIRQYDEDSLFSEEVQDDVEQAAF